MKSGAFQQIHGDAVVVWHQAGDGGAEGLGKGGETSQARRQGGDPRPHLEVALALCDNEGATVSDNAPWAALRREAPSGASSAAPG